MSQSKIRNFAIIAHIDHGKSTLADRFLEFTKTISKDKLREQFLDQNPISRERGITIKLAPVRMSYSIDGEKYLLNLIDTPGHMDFSYEVSRTLAACEGAILLVDATQGVQAQTMAHLRAARKEKLTIIPAINKIDLPTANVEKTLDTLENLLGFKREEVFLVSAKNGQNIEALLNTVVKKIPSPKGKEQKILRALIFDAAYDEHRGVIAFVRIFDGKIKKGDKIKLLGNNIKADIGELGYFSPFLVPKKELLTGEIGYIVTGIKDIKLCRVGDTVTALDIKKPNLNVKIEPLPGYKTPQPMVFFGVYPKNQNELIHLKEALNKLSLNDASLSISTEYSAFLGTGFRVGFLGLLHADIVRERLKQEANADPILTMPRVLYEKEEDGTIKEPYMRLTIYAPSTYVGNIMTACQKKNGQLIDLQYHKDSAILIYDLPYSMFIRGLASEIKSVSSGFATMDYELTDYRKGDLENLEILINNKPIDVLSELFYKDEIYFVAREKTEKLKELLPRQQFRQVIQAKAMGKIIAKTEISPYRKDVIAKLYGGDRTRKDKLLDKQKKGKAKMIGHGRINLPPQALYSLIDSNLEGK
ncbi:MAG: elongation factor 4 [Candidatus Levybacteria bacterium CG_4_9_14_3_um_filter_35_16]|nr:MAG: elongation factor 4 [Candidatus Levybacteria bacterium CG_4_9_14_3_um_filter_35_16]PJC54571.1 MAG: elongation factor 4 [Candidatus Levybacteria bacterium CG_4_9_14_0_2_um_filter_35_21]